MASPPSILLNLLRESVEQTHDKYFLMGRTKDVKKKIPLAYISLFSSVGVGCYGLKMAGFELYCHM